MTSSNMFPNKSVLVRKEVRTCSSINPYFLLKKSVLVCRKVKKIEMTQPKNEPHPLPTIADYVTALDDDNEHIGIVGHPSLIGGVEVFLTGKHGTVGLTKRLKITNKKPNHVVGLFAFLYFYDNINDSCDENIIPVRQRRHQPIRARRMRYGRYCHNIFPVHLLH